MPDEFAGRYQEIQDLQIREKEASTHPIATRLGRLADEKTESLLDEVYEAAEKATDLVGDLEKLEKPKGKETEAIE